MTVLDIAAANGRQAQASILVSCWAACFALWRYAATVLQEMTACAR